MGARPAFGSGTFEVGSVAVEPWEEDLVEVIYRGRITARLADEAFALIEPALRSTLGLGLLMNTIEATGFDPDLAVSTREIGRRTAQFRSARIVAVIPCDALRMTAQASAFASGVPLQIVPTRRDAFAYLRGDGRVAGACCAIVRGRTLLPRRVG